MALVMLVTIMPMAPGVVNAATGNLTIDYPGGKGTSSTDAIQVSDRTFRLTGSFSGFAVSSISYTVRNLGTGHTESGGTPYNPPSTSNYVYEGITLTPGVNEITVQTTAGLNRKIFVEFNDMPGIFNLTVNGESLVHDELVINATVIQGQAIAGSITGLATNATSVEITNQTLIATNANATISAQVFGATGMFTGTLPLTAGENKITFVAKNETKAVTEERRIIVNTITAGAGLNVYNLQSHYGAAPFIKNIPKDGQVDIKAGDANSNLNKKAVYTAGGNDMQFTGRLITNIGGAGYLELNQFRTIGTGVNAIRLHSDIIFDIQSTTGSSLIGGAKSLLTDSDVSTNNENPANIVAADKEVFDFARQLQIVRTMATAIAGIDVPADLTQTISTNNFNTLANNLSVATEAATLNNNLSAANTSLSAIGVSDIIAHPMVSATNLNSAADALLVQWISVTAGTTAWNTDLGGFTLAQLVTNLKNAATTYNAAADAIDTAGSPTEIQEKYTALEALARANEAITKDTVESGSNVHYYDFVTPIINEVLINFTHNTRYRIVITPKFYKANPVSALDYANFDPIIYEFTYIDSGFPRITSLQNNNTGEIIYNAAPPSTSYYRVSQRPFNVRVNFENFTAGTNVTVMHKAAPYPAELSGVLPATLDGHFTTSVTATDVTNGYVNIAIPNLLPGNNLIEFHYSHGGNSIVEKRVVLVVTTPLVTIRNTVLGEELANNKVYEFAFDPAVPSEDEDWFMDEHFSSVEFNFTGLSETNPLGSATNPISIKLNDTSVITGGITTGTAIGGALAAREVTGTTIQKVRIDFTHSSIVNSFRQGLNNLTVEFKNGHNPAKVEIQFYLFTESAPEVTNIRVVDHALPNNQEKQIVNFDPYVTNGDEVSIKGTIKNSDKFVLRIQGIDVIEYKLNDAGTQWVLQSTQLPTGAFTITAPVGTYKESEFTIHNYKLVNPSDNVLQGTFVFVADVSYKHTSTSRPITIMKQTDPYTVLAPYRQVVNNNYQKVIIKSESALSVTVGKEQAQRINISNTDVMSAYVADWLVSHLYGSNQGLYNSLGANSEVFFAEVPLKKGNNKIPITVDFGSQQVSGEIQVYYAATSQVGAVYKTNITNNRIRVSDWGNTLELNFPKGTLLQKKDLKIYGEYERYDEYYDIPNFWADKQLLIGIADYETGKVDRDIAKSTRADLRMSLNNSYYNNYFQYSSPLYYIDAGDLKHPGGRLPYESPEIVTRRVEEALEPTQRGTITITYNPSIVQDAGPHLAVMYNPGYTSIGSNTGWKNLGGVVNTKNNTIVVPFEGFGYYTVMKLNRSLSDIIFHPWARRNLEAMFSKGIMINEPGTNRFGTDLNITRGEFVTMLVKALQLPINAGPYTRQGASTLRPVNSSFDDIMPGMGDFFWSYEHLETAARAGIIQGKAPGLFMPNEQLTREQAAVIIGRAIEAKVVRTPELAMNQLTKDFTDATNIDTYARQAVAAISKAGVVVGKQNDPNDPTRGFSFLPKNNLTRAEASVIATRLMQQQKLLPDPL
jgi:hypothetical protein